jgi:hydrogenase nickel incorporation protein HypA/HybF
MHELSIAMNIAMIAEKAARDGSAMRVKVVEVDLGQLAGVVRESLEFAWESARQGTILEEADLAINELPGKAQCIACGHEYLVDHVFLACPSCGTFNPRIVQGRELRVKSIRVEEDVDKGRSEKSVRENK